MQTKYIVADITDDIRYAVIKQTKKHDLNLIKKCNTYEEANFIAWLLNKSYKKLKEIKHNEHLQPCGSY